MLHNQLIRKKSYTERYEEALAQIPLYTKEWTNFNISDPGITILESLSIFETLQQEKIDEMPVEVKERLLQMMGFTPKKAKPARVLLQAENVNEPFEIHQGQQFIIGDIQYEANRNIEVEGCRIEAIYAESNGEYRDISYALTPDIGVSSKAFNSQHTEGDRMYLICNRLPKADSEMYFYAECDSGNRTPLEEKRSDIFAEIEWECYTQDGFVKLNSKDYTGAFVQTGEIRMRMPADHVPAIYDKCPISGYCLRGTLVRSNYDITPVIKRFTGFLIEVFQRNTKAFAKSVPRGNRISVPEGSLDDKYFRLFVREEKGQPYHEYSQAYYDDSKGRFYDVEYKNGEQIFVFDKEKYNYGPDKQRESIKLLVYDTDIMKQYYLGEVLGHDDQIIELPVKNIVLESFSILLKRVIGSEEVYDFVKPNHNQEDELSYSVNESEGKLLIKHAGDFLGAEIYMGACSINVGDKGRVLAGNRFIAPGLENIVFTNPAPSVDGTFRESILSVRKRFLNDIDEPFALVTANDYEKQVQNTPGLCIKKVKAICDNANNHVMVAILPGINDERPVLPLSYKKIISEEIENQRLLCTRVTLVDPEYVEVNVHATIYIKPQYDNVEENLQDFIKDKLDYVKNDKQFGETLFYENIFHEVEKLPFVEFIYDLFLDLENSSCGKVFEKDIIPVKNGLIVPGRISLDLITYYE